MFPGPDCREYQDSLREIRKSPRPPVKPCNPALTEPLPQLLALLSDDYLD